MQEIKCPKCGEVFQVDDSGYAAIVKQVRDKEFNKEISNRETQFENDKNNAIELAKLELEKEYSEKLNQKESEIAKLESKLSTEKIIKESAINEALSEKDKQILELQNKINTLDKDNELVVKGIISSEILIQMAMNIFQ